MYRVSKKTKIYFHRSVGLYIIGSSIESNGRIIWADVDAFVRSCFLRFPVPQSIVSISLLVIICAYYFVRIRGCYQLSSSEETWIRFVNLCIDHRLVRFLQKKEKFLLAVRRCIISLEFVWNELCRIVWNVIIFGILFPKRGSVERIVY